MQLQGQYYHTGIHGSNIAGIVFSSTAWRSRRRHPTISAVFFRFELACISVQGHSGSWWAKIQTQKPFFPSCSPLHQCVALSNLHLWKSENEIMCYYMQISWIYYLRDTKNIDKYQSLCARTASGTDSSWICDSHYLYIVPWPNPFHHIPQIHFLFSSQKQYHEWTGSYTLAKSCLVQIGWEQVKSHSSTSLTKPWQPTPNCERFGFSFSYFVKASNQSWSQTHWIARLLFWLKIFLH